MFLQALNRWFVVGLLVFALCLLALGQEEINRKAKIKVQPACPELARRMNITGVVKVLITVSANGTVKDAKLIGGHPVLATAALEAVKKWRFDAGPDESTGMVQFRFDGR